MVIHRTHVAPLCEHLLMIAIVQYLDFAHHWLLASFPAYPIFILCFVLTIIYRSRGAVKDGEGLGEFVLWMMSGIRKVWTWGGGGEDRLQISLNTVEQLCLQHIKSGLVVKYSNLANWTMNWSRTCWTNYGPHPPTSILHPSDYIDMMNSPRPSPFFIPLPASVYYCQHKLENENGAGLETRPVGCPITV